MDEVVSVLEQILCKLESIESGISELNSNLEDVKGVGLYTSISDLADKLDDVQGSGIYTSISDVVDKLDDVVSAINDISLNM